MKILNKDITTIESGVIVHQVNCQGKMASGVALAIRNKWPQVYDDYMTHFSNSSAEKEGRALLLGHIDVIQIDKELSVVNLFGQNKYGYDGKRYTSYCAWEKALPKIKKEFPEEQIYFPYNVGCDRGGGDLRIISAMIEEYFPDAMFCVI